MTLKGDPYYLRRNAVLTNKGSPVLRIKGSWHEVTEGIKLRFAHREKISEKR